MTKQDRLWARYWSICAGAQTGYAMPILWHLALRGDPQAMTELGSTFDKPGRIADRFSQEGLAYRAWRRGHPQGAQHIAMNGFNVGDLAKYRCWLARCARLGDTSAALDIKRFETRLPHANARLIRRQRPHRRCDFK